MSVASDGTQANGFSDFPAISADGRFVAFQSVASNLVPGDTNDVDDVFVHDRQTGTTERVSVASDGTQGNGASLDGPVISADGRFVAFGSYASNLVPGDTNGEEDVFVHDRQTGTTERVSVASDGTQENDLGFPPGSFDPAISADGRFVAFVSAASNLVPGDTNDSFDVFIHDRQTGTTERVSVASDGTQADFGSQTPAISADGRFVAFSSGATNLVPGDTNGCGDLTCVNDVFVHDRQTGTTERVSVASDGTQANDSSDLPAISAAGRFVAFVSDATNLVAGDTRSFDDVFVHDRQTGTTERVSVASDGTQANSLSLSPAISADGRFVAFESDANNLVPGDTNYEPDVFVHVRTTAVTSTTTPGGSTTTTTPTTTPPTSSTTSTTQPAGTTTTTFPQPSTTTTTRPAPTTSTTPTTRPPTTTTTSSTTVTSTTIPTPPTTTTTMLPCMTARCTLGAALMSPACAGQTIPASVTGKFTTAENLIDQAATTPGKKAHKVRQRARNLLRQAGAKATHAAKGKKPKITPACAAALKDAAGRVAAGLSGL